MGKFACACGEHVFSDTVMPIEQLYHLIDSSTVWDYPEKIEGMVDVLPEMWECPKCKGITRFDNSAYRTCYYKRIDEVAEATLRDKATVDDKWFQFMVDEVGYEKARAYKDVVETEKEQR